MSNDNINKTRNITVTIPFYSIDRIQLLINSETGEILDASERAVHFYGYSYKTLCSSNIQEINILTEAEIKEEMERARSEERNHFFFKHKLASGGIRDVEVLSFPAKDENHKLLFSIIRDISEEIQARKEIEKSHQLLQKLSKQIPGMLFQFRMHTDGRSYFPFASEHIYTLFRLTPDDVRNEASIIFEKIDDRDVHRCKDSLRRSFEHLTRWTCEYRTRIDGKIRWLYSIAEPEKLEDNSVIWNGYCFDITDRKLAEAALQESENRHRKLMEHASDAILIAKASNGMIIDANKAALELLEYDANEIKNMHQTEIHPAHAETYYSNIFTTIANTGIDLEPELELLTKSGKIIPCEVRSAVIDLSGESLVLGIFRDVSERRKVEEALLRARAIAEDAARIRSEFIANVSHEIRTPMNAILGFSEVLLDQATNNEMRNHLQMIVSSGSTLLSIINDVLDISKIEAGKLSIDPGPTDFFSLLEETRHLFEHETEKKGLEFTSSITDVPEIINIDPVRLRQILFNIIGNAVKFTEQGSIIIAATFLSSEEAQKVYTQHFDDDTWQPGGTVLSIEIKDTGCGIDPAEIKNIFDIFSQSARAIKDKETGSGLGLTITRRLVEMMHGKILVKSKISEGSTFTVLIPAMASNHAEISEQEQTFHPSAEDFVTAKVLIVDDAIENRELFKTFLHKYPFEIIEAENGIKAVELAEKTNPDIMLIDIRMPGIDGKETLKRIRKIPALQATPAIAYTATITPLENGEQLFNGQLQKPAGKRALLNCLLTYLPDKCKK